MVFEDSDRSHFRFVTHCAPLALLFLGLSVPVCKVQSPEDGTRVAGWLRDLVRMAETALLQCLTYRIRTILPAIVNVRVG